MKVIVVNANAMELNGETQYFRHLVFGLKKLGIATDLEVDAVALTGRGKALKYDVQTHDCEGIEYCQYKRLAEKVKAGNYDYMLIAAGQFKGTYEWMEGIKIPYGIIVHSMPSVTQHNLETLWHIRQPYIVYALDYSIKQLCLKHGAPEDRIIYAGLPFCHELMAGPAMQCMPAPEAQPWVIVPSRTAFVKNPGHVAKLLVEAHLEVPELVGVFFGSMDFFAHTSGLQELIEKNDDFLTMQEPYFNEDDRLKWYNWATLAVDGTKLPQPPKRMQYSTMEAGYYGVPIIVEAQRQSELWTEGVHTLSLTVENIVRALTDAKLRQDMALNNYAYVTAMHDGQKIAHDILAPFIYGWVPEDDAEEIAIARMNGQTEEG